MMKNLLLYPSCKQGIVRKSVAGFFFLMLFSLGWMGKAEAQIYFHNFSTTTISSHPYTISPTATTVPGILNANLSNSSWTNSTGTWTSFTGNGGTPSQAIALSNSGGTPTITLTFDVAAGYQMSVTSFNFWRQRSTTGATNWSMTINGIAVGSGTVPTSGALIGNTAVSNAVNNLTGTITVVISLSGASSTGTFRLDDFTLNGTVILGPTLSADSPTGFGNVCINNTTGANTFDITGTALTAANVTVGPLAGYQFSLTNGSFTNSISFSLPGNQTQQIYVVFNPTLVQSYNGNIPISGGGATAITTPVTGAGVNTLPTISNGTVSGITTSAATIAAIISATGCTAISGYGIEYSTTPGFANGTGTAVAGSNLSGGNFSVGLTGLAPAGTTFYVHVYATNGGGTIYGSEISFTLLNTVPTLTVPAAGAGSLSPFGNVCINTASINSFNLSGNLLNGSNITIGALSNYTFSTTLSGTYTNTLTLTTAGTDYSYTGGVLSGCTIYVKFIPTAVQSYNGNISISGGGASAINVAASGSGINTAPTVSASAAVYVTTSTATLPGILSSGGCGVLLDYGFEYSTAPFAPGSGTVVHAANLAGTDFSYNLSGLTPGQIYYYYAFATNSGGTSYSTQFNFTTFGIPTKLVIISVSPASPIALTPFSVTVQAQDNAGNPVEVPTETDILLNQFAGTGVFTFPNAPLEAGTLFEGNSTLTITDVSYSLVENNVALTATASTGMTGLGTSVPFYFNVVAYSGPNNFIWSNAGGSTWLTGSNWLPGTAPGSTTTPGTNAHLASFTSQANLLTSAVGGCGINMNTANGVLNVGAIYFAETYNFAHTGDVINLGNNSTTLDGTLYLYGTALNTVGGIAGNNYANLLLANYMSNATTKTLEIRNTMGGGSKFMTLNIANAGSIVAGVGRTINLHTFMTGTANLTFTGGGTFSLNPSGFASVNTYSGAMTIANGTMLVGNTGVFNATTPNAVTLGAGTTAGVLRLNGNSVTIGALSNAGSAGTSNIVDNGNASATLTVNSTANTNFNGSLKNGSSGTFTLIKSGTGSLTLGGLNTYTGLTTVNAGTLRINYGPGNGLPASNSITVNGGTLRISTDQTLANLTLNAGTLTIDAGATLTITGTYTPGTCSINNNGTIKLQGGALQTFPGATATVNTMNNLTINNIFGVNLNKNLAVTGVLTLTAGTFTIGAFTLTIQNPIAGTPNNLAGDQTSSMVIAGTAAGVNIPASITQLNNLTVSNTSGTTLQGNLNVKTAVQISSTAGFVYTGLNTFNGTANLSMQGGNLYMEKNGVVLPEFSGAYSLTGGTVTFAGVGISSDAQTVRPINYFNLVSDLDGDRILNNTGTIGVLNNFVPSTSPYSNAYTITGSTVDFIKASAGQTIPAFTYYNIRVSGGSALTKTLNGHINVVNSLIMATNTKLSLDNFNVTLKSSQTQTASVDVIPTANSFTYGGTGRFVVERFIGTGVVHTKGWQLLAVPTTGQTVKEAWQENAANVGSNPVAGYGIQITSDLANATTLGFDIATPTGSGPGMKTYNSATNNYTGIANTNALPLYNKKGYMVFVRGDRSVTTSAQAATTTILRSTGKLFAPGTDAPASTTVAAGKFESVGNPYASAISFTSVLSGSTGIDAKFYVWDPSYPGTQGYGGFQSMSSVDGYLPHPGGSTYYPTGTPVTKIQSGQAFLVYSTAGGTLNFTEANKTSGSALVARQQQTKITLNSWLYKNNGQLIDGNAIVFDAAYSNTFDAHDAEKFNNGGESLGILVNDQRLAIEARNLPVVADTIQYITPGLRQLTYTLALQTTQWSATGMVAVLVDQFTGNRLPLSVADTTAYTFAVTADAASQSDKRFIVVFQSLRPVPVSYIELTGTRNRSTGIQLNWKVAGETDMQQYVLQRKTINGQWNNIVSKAAQNAQQAFAFYNYLDALIDNQPVQYRVQALGLDQRIQYSNTISFGKQPTEPGWQLLQNPVQQAMVRIRYNDLIAGKYQVQLTNESGQVVWNRSVIITQTGGTLALPLTQQLAAGLYRISVTSERTNWQASIILE